MDQETINGTPVTEDQIAAWAAEAEQRFDVDALKKRGRGRPGRGGTLYDQAVVGRGRARGVRRPTDQADQRDRGEQEGGSHSEQ